MQLAALYAAAGPAMLTVADLAEQLGRSPSATSRIVSGLVRASVDEALLIAARQDPDGPFAEEDPR